MSYLYLQIIAIALMLVGVAGVILPALPGVLLMFIIALAFAFFDNFGHITYINLIVLGAISLLSIAIDYFSGLFGGKYFGATKRGFIGGIIGTIVGTLFFAPFGTIIGLFFGILIAELAYDGDNKKATKAAIGGFLGTAVGVLINLFLALLFLTLFIIFSI